MKTKISLKAAKPLIAVTFPDYTGRKVAIEFTERVTFYDTNWGGGTKNFYAAVKATGEHQNLYVPAPWANNIEGTSVDLPRDTLLVEHSIFCGHDLGITIYAHPSLAPRWLPATADHARSLATKINLPGGD